MDYTRYGEKIVSLCSNKGVSACDVCIEDRIERTVALEKDEITSEREKYETTLGLRVFMKGRKGFEATTLPRSAEEIVQRACTLARYAEEDPHWSLPSPHVLPEIDIYDPRLADLTLEELVALSDLRSPFPEVFIDTARITTSVVNRWIVNSEGVDYAYKSTKWYIFLSCLPREGKASAAMDWAVSRHLDIDCDHLVESVAETVRDSLKAESLTEDFKGEVLFSENVCSQVFMNTIATAVNAENLRRHVSPFENKMKERVASENVTVRDNGLFAKGVCSQPCDREGNLCQETLVIDNGILESILHNEYTSSLYQTQSTGNAVGSAMTEPVVGVSNLILTPGDYATERIIEEMEKGLYVKGLSGGTDVTTGDFSGVVPHGYYIEHGEIKAPARALISGNSFPSLLHVRALGKEQKPNLEGIYAVPVLVEGINIIHI
jgi:PmbA protein